MTGDRMTEPHAHANEHGADGGDQGLARLTYYNPMLDPYCQSKMTPKMLEAVLADTYAEGGPLEEPDAQHPQNLISSLCTDGLHRPALDVDVPLTNDMRALLSEFGNPVEVPSSTKGHCHVYIDDVAFDWPAYQEFLTSMVRAGIVDAKYVEHSVARGQTLLRMPGCRKATIGEVAAIKAWRLAS